MINPGATFVAAFVTFGVYFAMERRTMRARWGDMRNALLMVVVRAAMSRLSRRGAHERTWRPNLLVLSGAPTSRWHLIDLADAISHDRGFLTVAAIVPEQTGAERAATIARAIADYLEKRDISAFVKVHSAPDPLTGATTLARSYGYGPITPNTLLLGETERPENYHQFAELILAASRRRQNIIIVRESETPPEEKRTERIDVWWYGTQQNLGLMLALAHLLKRSALWRRATLTLKSVVTEAEKKDEALERLQTFIRNVRVDAEAEVFVESPADIFSFIRRHSENADLVLLGMRTPRDDETPEEYSGYYEQFLSRSTGLPAAAFVLATEDIDFKAIFKES